MNRSRFRLGIKWKPCYQKTNRNGWRLYGGTRSWIRRRIGRSITSPRWHDHWPCEKSATSSVDGVGKGARHSHWIKSTRNSCVQQDAVETPLHHPTGVRRKRHGSYRLTGTKNRSGQSRVADGLQNSGRTRSVDLLALPPQPPAVG